MRSLRRVLLPLVLLAGLAFRGVRFDDAAAAPAPLLLPFPPPPQQPAPPLALPAGGGRGDEADSTEIVAVPAPLPPRELLVRPPRHRPVPMKAVTEDTEPAVSSELQFYDNGTIQLVDRLSQAPLWQLSTGPPISKHITTTNSDLSYLIYPLDGSDLMEVHNGTNVKLPWELEEFIARTPYIRDSVVTIGSKASTIFAVDADSGEIIYKHSLPAALNELGEPPVEEAPSKLDAGTSPNIIVVVRTDYSLSASDLGVHLFNWTRTSFSANYYVKHSHSDMLEQSSCLRGNIPCIRTNGVPLKLTLPDSSTANALVLLDVNKVTTRDDANALRLLGTLVNSRQTGSKSGIVLDGTQNRTVGGALGHLVSADPQTNRFTNHAYGFLFPVLPLLVVLAWLVRLAYSSKSCRQFMSLLMKPFVREKKSMDFRGKSEGASKRRKTRKKDGTSNSSDIGSASDKESSGTGGSNETLCALPDGLDGCQIGKLCVHKKEIGKGSNGTVVFEGSYDGREVAVKRLLLSHTDIAQKEIQNLIASDRDPNIVRLYGCDQDDNFVYISLERCRCSLADLVQQHVDPSLSDAERIDVELWTQDGLPSVQLLKLMRQRRPQRTEAGDGESSIRDCAGLLTRLATPTRALHFSFPWPPFFSFACALSTWALGLGYPARVGVSRVERPGSTPWWRRRWVYPSLHKILCSLLSRWCSFY